jgi:hypothetical protein
MKKLFSIILFVASLTLLQGCLIFHKMSYEIDLETPQSGVAIVEITDIRSDARNEEEFNEDIDIIYNFIRKSDEFKKSLQEEGKELLEREIYLSGDTLNGRIKYSFKNINDVERIVMEDGFYFLTLPLEDSILSTNGEIIRSKTFKRILWDQSVKKLKFEILSFSFETNQFRSLVPYYEVNQ